MQRDGHALPILKLGKRFVRAFVVRQGFFEAILAMEDIANVILETSNTPRLALFGEYLSRAFRSLKGPVVFSK